MTLAVWSAPRAVFTLILAILAASPSLAADQFVSSAGSDTGNDCLTSTAPCRTVGHALAQAASGDTVKVAAGTYQENLVISSSRTLTLSGGWAGDFTSNSPATQVTTLNGGKTAPVIHINAESGDTIDVELEGFTVTGGVPGSTGYGAGISARSLGSLTLNVSNMVLTKNAAPHLGLGNGFSGGLGIVSSSTGSLTANLVNVTITKNQSGGGSGGGIFAGSSENSHLSLSLTDTTVTKNTAQFDGGGITAGAADTSSLSMTLTNVSVTSNTTKHGRGGGMFLGGSFSLSVVNSLFSANKAPKAAGGGLCLNPSPGTGTATITNSIITLNKAQSPPGGLWAVGSLALGLTNCTFQNNKPTGTALLLEAGTGENMILNIRNTIVRGSGKTGFEFAESNTGGVITVNADHDDIANLASSGVNDLGGNIDTPPLLVKGVHLKAGSPCIDTGTCDGAPATDFFGNPRPTGAGCDIGADEFVP